MGVVIVRIFYFANPAARIRQIPGFGCVCVVGSGPGRKRCFSIIAPSSRLVMGREKKNINENFAKNCIFKKS